MRIPMKFVLILTILLSSISFANAITSEEINQSCKKMKPYVYLDTKEGKVARIGCKINKRNYIIIYEVTGNSNFINSIKVQSSLTDSSSIDQKELNKYCTSYNWLRNTNLVDSISVEYYNNKNVIASKQLNFKDCK